MSRTLQYEDAVAAARAERSDAWLARVDACPGGEDLQALVDGLTFKEKVDRALDLIRAAHAEFGERLVVANSLGMGLTWDLAKRASPDIRGFIVVTPHSHPETLEFMERVTARYPELAVYRNEDPIPQDLCRTDPDRCCMLLKVEPARRAIREMGAACWVTGVRCTAGRTRRGFREIELREDGLWKLNPILTWYEREAWQYAAVYGVEVNPLYKEGYRSLGCAPCTRIVAGPEERAGRWNATSKCGGECGLNTKPMKLTDGAGI